MQPNQTDQTDTLGLFCLIYLLPLVINIVCILLTLVIRKRTNQVYVMSAFLPFFNILAVFLYGFMIIEYMVEGFTESGVFDKSHPPHLTFHICNGKWVDAIDQDTFIQIKTCVICNKKVTRYVR